MARPVCVFLSYRRLDAGDASELERQFGLRGLRLWRDVNDLPLGGSTIPEIKRGIRSSSDAFVLYVTPRIYASDVVWRIEVPAALTRARARRPGTDRPPYPIVPILRGQRVHDLRAFTRTRENIEAFPEKNAASVPLSRDQRATMTARRLAFADAGCRLLRTILPTIAGRRLGIALHSFPSPEAPHGALDMDWTDAVDGANPAAWAAELFPALDELRRELARARRDKLDLFVKLRLSAALAFGVIFPLASGFDLRVRDRQGIWSSRVGAPPLVRPPDGRTGATKRVVLEISLAQDGRGPARALADRLRARHVRLLPPRGPSRGYDPRPVAGAIAAQVGEVVRELRRDGMEDLHLDLVAPAALAVLIGRQLHAIGRIHSYYRTPKGLIRAFTRKT